MRERFLCLRGEKLPHCNFLKLLLLALFLVVSLSASGFGIAPSFASGPDGSCEQGSAPTFDPPDFAISVDPPSQTVEPGETGIYALSINTINCYTATLTLSLSGLPDHATFAFDPATLVPPADGSLTVATTVDTPPGAYALVVSADSDELHREVGVELIVNEPPAPDPDFTVAVSPASQTVDPGDGTSYAVNLEAFNGFTETVSLAVAGVRQGSLLIPDLPEGVVATLDPEALAPPGTSLLNIVTAVDTPAGSYELVIDADGGGLGRETSVELIVNEPPVPDPDFTLAANPASQTVQQGGGTTYAVDLEALNGFSEGVSLSIAGMRQGSLLIPGLPEGTVAIFDPETLAPPGTSSLTLATSAETPVGSYELVISADGDGLERETSVELIVNEPAGQALVSVSPAEASVFVGQTAESQIMLSDAVDFYGIEFFMTFNPAALQVVDADPTLPGVQVGLGALFPEDQYVVGVNQVFTDTGQVVFGVARRAPALPVSGGSVLAHITWEAVGEGVSDLSFTHLKLADPSGFELPATSQGGVMTAILTGDLRGAVRLQGRQNHSGVEISVVPDGLQTLTDILGWFEFLIHGTLTVTARMYGYLDAEVAVDVAPGESVDLGTAVLYGGEVTGDNLIDIGDLSYLGARFHTTDLSADINGDGEVDILDLAMAAANFLKSGPTPWSE